ncbi:MAG TPA: hypothetical protein DCE14_09605 [Kosmotogaceae bacterium]|nr:hypothetical protein [Kosmotogaceae bacterium]
MIIPMRRNRGGTARSSDEAPVMGVEPRGCVIQFCEIVNQTEKVINQKWEESHSKKMGGANEQGKVV